MPTETSNSLLFSSIYVLAVLHSDPFCVEKVSLVVSRRSGLIVLCAYSAHRCVPWLRSQSSVLCRLCLCIGRRRVVAVTPAMQSG